MTHNPNLVSGSIHATSINAEDAYLFGVDWWSFAQNYCWVDREMSPESCTYNLTSPQTTMKSPNMELRLWAPY